MIKIRHLFIWIFLLFQLYNFSQAKIVYVDKATGANSNNGLAWTSAWRDLTHALYWALPGDEIWISQGTYTPKQDGVFYLIPELASFVSRLGGVKIYGGFSKSAGATTWASRNPSTYPVILSGEIQNDNNPKNNSRTVVSTNYANGFAVLDGVTVTGGYNELNYGGGIYLDGCSPIINNCIISNNLAKMGGGIMVERNLVESKPIITNCAFNSNTAQMDVNLTGLFEIGGKGGAIYNSGCSPTISNCSFGSNSANVGAAICNFDKSFDISSPSISNCYFAFNYNSTGGAAIFEIKSNSFITGCTFTYNKLAIDGLKATSTITNCLFTQNGNPGFGGAINILGGQYKIIGCTFNGNSAFYGGAVYVELTDPGPTGQPVMIRNCLFVANSATRGGAVFSKDAFVKIVNCTFTQNNSSEGIIQTEGSASLLWMKKVPEIVNTICYNNNGPDLKFVPLQFGSSFYNYDDRPNVRNSMFWNISGFGPTTANDLGDNMFNVNPLLDGTFQLTGCSRAINAGRNPSVLDPVDKIGNPRIVHGIVDLGCSEYLPMPGGYRVYGTPVSVCEGGSAVIWGINRTVAGTYDKVFIAQNGCDSVVSIVFSINPKPTATITNSNNCGTTGTINLIPTSGTAPFTCVLNSTSISGIAMGTNADFTNLAPGTYPFTLTDANGCVTNGNANLTTYNISQTTIYVDAKATGLNNGLSWANAFTDLQSALDLSNCTIFTEIYVSEGYYTPTKNTNGNYVTTSYATFQMKNNLKIMGGFSTTSGATTLASRNPNLYKTILSGDSQQDGILTNNAYNVINNYNTNLNNTAVLDGFTILDAYNSITGVGGGMINNGSSPTIENCIFTNNYTISTDAKGGAIYNGAGSNPIIKNCKFINNYAEGTNSALGSAISNINSSPIISLCTFDGNIVTSSTSAGALYSFGGSNVKIDNCLFINNNGAAICSDGNSNIINNCTITKNTSTIVSVGGGLCFLSCNPFITNTIIYGNTGSVGLYPGANPTFFYCNVEGSGGSAAWNPAMGINGGANLDVNPRFNSNYHLSLCSPSINAGTSGYSTLTTDLDALPRIVTILDQGCYEFQSTLTYSGIVYVDSAATGANNGLSWSDAFKDLQSALDLTCFPITEIWVSKGTYFPSKNPSKNTVSDPTATFQMRNGVKIYGGFSTSNGITTLASRNWNLYPTILSGNMQNDNIKNNNSYNVVNNYALGLDNSAVLDGFIIQDAYNTFDISGGSGITWGAGMINFQSSPKIINCTFTENTNASINQAFGGAMFNKDCSPEINNCKFIKNYTTGSAVSYGGAIANINSSPIIKNCIFDGNISQGPNTVGGAMYSSGGAAISIDNCLFVNNIGGAICTDGNSHSINNTTITRNIGTNLNAGGIYSILCSPFITNSIIFNNSGGSITTVSSSPGYFYCDVEGSGGSLAWNSAFGINWGANIDSDPFFTNDYKLTTCSPAINSASNTYSISSNDLSGQNRINTAIVDMGCYEFYGAFPSAYGSIVYVNQNATGANNGLTWADAFTDLQKALDLTKCTTISQIWVSKGTYTPSKDYFGRYVTDATATFKMINNVEILGGFSVSDGATSLASRNYDLFPTVLFGEVFGIRVYNVINNYNTGINTSAILDGFTVSQAFNNINGLGGGIINENTSPTIKNCKIRDNAVGGWYTTKGAGIYNVNASPIISNCNFYNNTSSGITDAFGGAICNVNSNPLIQKCNFNVNIVSAPNAAGGAIYSFGGSNVTIDNCLFSSNNGAAICSDGNNTHINNCTITQNTSTPTSVSGGLTFFNCSPFITNSIIWNNTNGSVNNTFASPSFFYCDIEGSGAPSVWNPTFGINWGANIDLNPLLKSNFSLEPCSPTINIGTGGYSSLTTDLFGNPRIVTTLDLGCYEYQNSLSYSGVVYVNASATGANTGLSWIDAFTSLQSALDLTCFPVTEIWVSKGTYTPSKNASGIIDYSPLATFKMRNNLKILGGFSVSDGAITLASRNWKTYVTNISGDIHYDGTAGNSFVVITNNGLDATAILDGFSILDGVNNSTGLGSGILNTNSSPTISNCIIRANFAGGTFDASGAGMHNINSSPILTNCIFSNNTASGITNAKGGAISNDNSSPVIKLCKFDNNIVSAPNAFGGGIYSFGGSNATIDNSLFINNNGSAICSDGNNTQINNCTITQNSSTTSSFSGGLSFFNCSPFITNSIIWNNTNGSVYNSSASPSFFYCDVEGSGAPSVWNPTFGINWGANLDQDPRLTFDYKLSLCSPAIDAGTGGYSSLTTDLDENPRVVTALDLGCYEYPVINTNVIVYVNANATGANNGQTWADAYTDLQKALDLTCYTEIWVSKGIYTPSKNSAGINDLSPLATFKMRNNLKILGGFSVSDGATTLASRNWKTYPTTISGDLQQDGAPGNSKTVITNNGLNATAILDGFIISDGFSSLIGSGMSNINSSPTISNCSFLNNKIASSTTAKGAGMYNLNSSPNITNCIFKNNVAGGFIQSNGSAIYNENSSPIIKLSVFDGNNVAGNNAIGTIYSNGGSDVIIDNCLFINNNGSAICSDGNNTQINNCTITQNTSTMSSIAGGLTFFNCSPFVTNSIIWNNTNGSVFNSSASPGFFYCDVDGSGAPSVWNPTFGINWGANLDKDPFLTSDFKLSICSPAINVGTGGYSSLIVDLDGNARVVTTLDLGCYEFDATINFSNVPNAIGNFVATSECTDASGWTHYYSASGQILLSIQKNGNNIGSVGDGIFSVNHSVLSGYGTGSALNLTMAPYVQNPNGWFVMNRYWNVNPTFQPISPVNVRTYFTNSDFTDLKGSVPALNAISEIKFFKITGVNPDPSTGHLAVMPANYSEPTNTTASYGTNYLSQFQVNSFSGGGAGVGGNANGFGALPVEWLDFNVVKNNNDAIISWSTFENNNKGFEIQRSTNGIDFKSIDFVNSLANQSVNQYLKTDFEPGNEVFYYRIAQIDLDGKISFSQIKSVNFKENLPFSIDLYPNPAQYHTQILIQSNKPSITSIQLLDINGKLIKNLHQKYPLIEGENKLNIDLENITSGMYIIEIEIDGIRKQIKLIKNL